MTTASNASADLIASPAVDNTGALPGRQRTHDPTAGPAVNNTGVPPFHERNDHTAQAGNASADLAARSAVDDTTASRPGTSTAITSAVSPAPAVAKASPEPQYRTQRTWIAPGHLSRTRRRPVEHASETVDTRAPAHQNPARAPPGVPAHVSSSEFPLPASFSSHIPRFPSPSLLAYRPTPCLHCRIPPFRVPGHVSRAPHVPGAPIANTAFS